VSAVIVPHVGAVRLFSVRVAVKLAMRISEPALSLLLAVLVSQ
jgi:hypothetical protein